MIQNTSMFNYGFSAHGCVDRGIKRNSNQDEIIMCPETGFYAVADGMGGFRKGGETSQKIKYELPAKIDSIAQEWMKDQTQDHAKRLLKQVIQQFSDTIFNRDNNGFLYVAGATLSGVWLVGCYAVFVNLGDSRGYFFPKDNENLIQVTTDHNEAANWVPGSRISLKQAQAQLNRFIGMAPPVKPDVFVRKVQPGDRILLCSDGLHGMVGDADIVSIINTATNPEQICEQLVKMANDNGGEDNIAVVYVKIDKKNDC